MNRCPLHDLAIGPEGGCVLCRREDPKALRRERRPGRDVLLLVLAVSLLLGAGVIATREAKSSRSVATASSSAVAPSSARTGTLTATNSVGRSGAFYLPAGYATAQLPLLVAIHGTGGSGADMVHLFRSAADSEKFIVVAPDSRTAPNGEFSWEVPDHPNDTSGDTPHVRACVDEVLAMPGVRIDPERVLVAGHSGGGSTAAYTASNDPLYSAYAVLHGGVFAGGLGSRTVRGWFSTGTADPIRTPTMVRDAAQRARAAGLGEVEYREFQGGHGVAKEEVHALVAWWLGR